MSSRELARVTHAATMRDRAGEEFRAALADARKVGCSFAEIARAAGITRQGARKVLMKR
jgi:hypothetical protein